MSFSVRLARAADAERLRDVERLAGERFRSVGLDAVADDEPMAAAELAAHAGAGRVWVAVDGGGAVVGYVLAAEVDGNAHVEQVSVVPAWQGRGVGRALLGEVEAWAAARGLPALTLTTFAEVPWNRPLYEHLGFRVLGDDEVGPGLRAVVEAEAAQGLAPETRVCMARPVSPRG